MLRVFFILCCSIITLSVSAQRGTCGVMPHDQLHMEEEARLAGPSRFPHSHRNMKIYIPIAFHIVTKGDGTGGIKQSGILAQMCKLNSDFAQWDMVFYLADGVNYNKLRGDNLYTDPRSSENRFRSEKDPNAINVFITGDIGSSGNGPGTVLGYYSPTNDLLVCRLDEVAGATNTLSHEVGHFFSLRHTFFGFECEPYDVAEHGNPLSITTAPCANVPVELVDKSNCNTAADQLCDTPPDYNFGIGQYSTGCDINIQVTDSNGDRVIPMANNQMSYFTSCSDFAFTEDQYNRMLGNYNRATRDYLKSNYTPNESIITGPVITSPTTGEKVDAFNGVTIEWEGDANTEMYLVEINGANGDDFFYYTNDNSLYTTDLAEREFYFFKIFAFNDGYFCAEASDRGRFETGSQTTNTADIKALQDLKISPNPANERLTVSLNYIGNAEGILSIVDVSGKTIVSHQKMLNDGDNRITIDINDLSTGVHFLRVVTKDVSYSRKFVVID